MLLFLLLSQGYKVVLPHKHRATIESNRCLANNIYLTTQWIISTNIQIQYKYKHNGYLYNTTSVLEAAEEACGTSKGRSQHGETWWWNQDVQKAISEKRKNFQR